MDESGPNRIEANVLDEAAGSLTGSWNVIEGFRLPERPFSTAQPVHSMRRWTLDCLKNFGDRVGFAMIVVEGREQQMHVIWHDDHSLQIDRATVGDATTVQNNVALFGREPSMVKGVECDKQLAIALNVREAAAIVVLPLYCHVAPALRAGRRPGTPGAT